MYSEINVILNFYNKTCKDILYNELKKYECQYNIDLNNCCLDKINSDYNNYYNNEIKLNTCYNYKNITFDFNCKYYNSSLIIYIIGLLFAFVFFISIIYLLFILIKKNCTNEKYSRLLEYKIILHKKNPIYDSIEDSGELL